MPLGFMFNFMYELLWFPKMLFNMPRFFDFFEVYIATEFGFGYSFVPFYIDYYDDKGVLHEETGIKGNIRDALISGGAIPKVVFGGFRWAVFCRIRILIVKRFNLTLDLGYPNMILGFEIPL